MHHDTASENLLGDYEPAVVTALPAHVKKAEELDFDEAY